MLCRILNRQAKNPCLWHGLWACRGLHPLDPWSYIPVTNINILFIPVPNILFIPVSRILFIPVSSTFFIPVPYIFFIPVANTLFISVNHIFFIPVSNTFLSQSAAHSLSQPATYSYLSQQHTLYPSFTCSSSTSLFLLLPEPKLLRSDLHVSFSTYSLYQQKSYQYYNIKPKSCVLLFCLDIIYLHFFYLLYFITILISTLKSFFALSSAHLSIFLSTPFFICHYQLKPNILFTFTFPCLFYYIPISTFIKPFLLSSIIIFMFTFIHFPV